MALTQKLTSNIDYTWLNDSTFQKGYSSMIMIGLGDKLRSELKKNGNKLPLENSLIYVQSYIFKVVEIKQEKGGLFSSGKATISLSFVAEDKEETEKIIQANEYKPEGQYINEQYVGYHEIAGRKVKIMFPLSCIPEQNRSQQHLMDMALSGTGSTIAYYYKVFGHYPSTGEILSNGSDALVHIKKKYFLRADNLKGETEDRLGFIVELNYDRKNLSQF
jgi:hypothetical protein